MTTAMAATAQRARPSSGRRPSGTSRTISRRTDDVAARGHSASGWLNGAIEAHAYPVRRNTALLGLCLVLLSGVLQLAVAVATITLVLVTGIESILGLGPAIFLTAGAARCAPRGASDGSCSGACP